MITQEVKEQATPKDYIEFAGGVDFGIRDATAATFGGYTRDYTQCSVIDEYYHSNANTKESDKDLPTYAMELVAFFADKYDRWCREIGQQVLYIFTDYARQSINDPVFYRLCNDTAKANGIDYLEFVPATKAKIATRILMVNSLGASEKLVLFPNTTNLQRELESMSFVEGKEYEREDGDDHTLNAMEYMLEARSRSI